MIPTNLEYCDQRDSHRFEKTSRPGGGMIKKLVLIISESLIIAGTRLHNIYQPSIEETLEEYMAILAKTKPE